MAYHRKHAPTLGRCPCGCNRSLRSNQKFYSHTCQMRYRRAVARVASERPQTILRTCMGCGGWMLDVEPQSLCAVCTAADKVGLHKTDQPALRFTSKGGRIRAWWGFTALPTETDNDGWICVHSGDNGAAAVLQAVAALTQGEFDDGAAATDVWVCTAAFPPSILTTPAVSGPVAVDVSYRTCGAYLPRPASAETFAQDRDAAHWFWALRVK